MGLLARRGTRRQAHKGSIHARFGVPRRLSTSPATWRAFGETYAAYEAGKPPYDGIGFVFAEDDPFVGIDLDMCRDPENGEIAPWAQGILDRAHDGYFEVSPSGTGVHVIVEGEARGSRRRKKVRLNGQVVGELERYDRARFFTVTGVAP